MDTFLLATKVRIPPEPHRAVRRARLLDALERSIPDYKLTVISAPAGYGKSTLLVQWAHVSRLPIAWLSLDEQDNDLDRFMRYLLAAWEAVQPSVRESRLGLLLGASNPDREAILSAFINLANDAHDHTVFVLDDYHLIEDPPLHEALAFLLDHLPPKLHFVLAGRAEPPLPLARYRARHELLEFRAEDLQFLPEETSDFLNDLMRLDLNRDTVAALQAQSEGWIAGLQLASLSLQRGREAVDKLIVSGRNRFIADYLSEDVLAHLSADVRQFLLQTSILDRLCGSLCDALTGGASGQEMLARLEQANLFLMPLDDSREWYRYHRLFADFLQGELTRHHPERLAELHRRAARWYFAHDLPEQAFDHAVAGDDPELVMRIQERYVNIKLNSGELKVVAHWCESLPAEWYSAYPLLNFGRAGLLLYTGAFEAGLGAIDDVEQRLTLVQTENTRWQLAIVTAVRCFVACIQNDLAQAKVLADQALPDLREESASFRASVYHALGDTYRRNGRWDEAKASYLKVPSITAAPGFRVQFLVQGTHVFGALADLELRLGRLRNAAGYWRNALAAIHDEATWGRLELPVIGWVYIRLGEILYEWNELEAASNHLSQGLERSELGGDVRAMIAGYLLAGRLRLTAGDLEAAGEYLERARPLVESASFADWASRFERLQLELWLAQDRLRTAVDWADVMLRGDAFKGPLESEEAQLAMARVLIAKGDGSSVDQAMALLKRLLATTEAEGRMGVQIEALALQALADWRRGERAGAMTNLERALRLAEPEGYVRLFADLRLPMARALQEARSRDVMPDYVGKLLAAFGGDLSSSPSVERALPEPLTPREQEVLELVAAGLTNREIAERLIVSAETVKKHVGNLCAKLGVGNRTQAAARARELKLLN